MDSFRCFGSRGVIVGKVFALSIDGQLRAVPEVEIVAGHVGFALVEPAAKIGKGELVAH